MSCKPHDKFSPQFVKQHQNTQKVTNERLFDILLERQQSSLFQIIFFGGGLKKLNTLELFHKGAYVFEILFIKQQISSCNDL